MGVGSQATNQYGQFAYSQQLIKEMSTTIKATDILNDEPDEDTTQAPTTITPPTTPVTHQINFIYFNFFILIYIKCTVVYVKHR